MRASFLSTALAALLLVPGMVWAEDLAAVSDLDLLAKTREAVGAQDADGTLQLLTEMQRRGIGLFAGQGGKVCKEVIALPDGITDWRFRGAARQAYIATAKAARLEAQSCACPFADFSFDQFVKSMLHKSAAELTDADRAAFETYLAANQRDVEDRYRLLERSCRAI